MDNKETITSKLNAMRAMAAILDTMYQPMDEMMRERKCTQTEAIGYKEAADKYMKKCGARNIRKTINEIIELME